MKVAQDATLGSLLMVALIFASLTSCAARKPPFSLAAFETAKKQCGATDAYIVAAAPNTIGFRGDSEGHVSQARCLKEKLAGTDVQTVVLGSQLHES